MKKGWGSPSWVCFHIRYRKFYVLNYWIKAGREILAKMKRAHLWSYGSYEL